MEIVVARHGARDANDLEGNLSERGDHQARMLAQSLKRRGSKADVILTSRSTHAYRTAVILGGDPGHMLQPLQLQALTPGGGPGGLEDVLMEVSRLGFNVQAAQCIVIVGHEGRLSDLVTELTGDRFRPVVHGGAVSLVASSLMDLRSGRACVHYWYPTVNHQEEALRAKVNSKMTVATFLAGFVFAALNTMILLEETDWTWPHAFTATTLTASLALLVSCVYFYDQLGTPVGYWTDADRPRLWRRLYASQERRLDDRWLHVKRHAMGDEESRARAADEDKEIYRSLKDGPTYWSMVKVSRLVFNPALVLALAGYVSLLVSTGERAIIGGGVVALIIAALYAARHRPDLGAD